MTQYASPALRERPARDSAPGEGEAARLRIVNLHSALAGPFNLSVDAGECIAVTGASGSGKSLFLRMIADLDPNRGEVFLNGRERRSYAAPAWRQRVVYNAAEPGWWHETVIDHFPPSTRDFAQATAPRLGLAADLLEGPVVRLSTGERQRLALIRALALSSPVLLLDEPTGALDQTATECVEAILRERLAQSVAIVMVTHSAEQAKRLGYRHFQMTARHLVTA